MTIDTDLDNLIDRVNEIVYSKLYDAVAIILKFAILTIPLMRDKNLKQI